MSFFLGLSHCGLNIVNEANYLCDRVLRQLDLGESANSVHVGNVSNGLFRDASTGNLPDAQRAEVFDHGVDGRFQRSGVSADLAEQQAALDGGQRRECQVVDLGAVG